VATRQFPVSADVGDHEPHNSLYVISDSGQIVERYDKRFCSGGPDGSTSDLAHYSPGSHAGYGRPPAQPAPWSATHAPTIEPACNGDRPYGRVNG
jgi:hypothetical protein